jgi:hypothetical protein
MAALSQLSYSPELVVGREVYRGLLVVAGGFQAEVDRRLPATMSIGSQ